MNCKLNMLLDGAEVEWKALGEVAVYSRRRVSSDTLDETNYVGVDNLLQNRLFVKSCEESGLDVQECNDIERRAL